DPPEWRPSGEPCEGIDLTADSVDFPSCARVGGRPPIPPARRRTGAIRGSRLSKHRDCGRIASAFRLPLPSVFVLELRSGGGTTPHTPRASAYWCDTRVASVKAPGLWADRVGFSPAIAVC